MTNTTNNVPRELKPVLAMILNALDRDAADGKQARAEMAAELRALLSAPSPADHVEDVRAMVAAPSPAGVDGLNTDRNAAFKACPESGCDWGSFYLGWKARGEVEQAIIDGLAVENHQLRRELNLRQSQIESSDHIAERAQRFAVQLRTERDQQAQRIGELEGLLRDSAELIKHGVFEDGICCCGSSVDSHGFGDGHSPVDALAYHAGQVCERIDAALSAGKEGE